MKRRTLTNFIIAGECAIVDITLDFGGHELSCKIARVIKTANAADMSEEAVPFVKALVAVFDAIKSATSSQMSRKEWMDIVDNVEMFTLRPISLDKSDKDDSYDDESYESKTAVSRLIGDNIARLHEWMNEIADESGDYIQFTAIE